MLILPSHLGYKYRSNCTAPVFSHSQAAQARPTAPSSSRSYSWRPSSLNSHRARRRFSRLLRAKGRHRHYHTASPVIPIPRPILTVPGQPHRPFQKLLVSLRHLELGNCLLRFLLFFSHSCNEAHRVAVLPFAN